MTDDELDHRECAETVTGEIDGSEATGNPVAANHSGPDGRSKARGALRPPHGPVGSSPAAPFPDETERCCEDECTAPAEVFPGGNDKPGYCQRCWTRSLQGEQW